MKIASLQLRFHPEQLQALQAHLAQIAGVSLHGLTADGSRLVALVEDGPGYAVSDSILALSIAPGVLGITLAYEYSDEDCSPAELAAALASSKKRPLQEMQA